MDRAASKDNGRRESEKEGNIQQERPRQFLGEGVN